MSRGYEEHQQAVQTAMQFVEGSEKVLWWSLEFPGPRAGLVHARLMEGMVSVGEGTSASPLEAVQMAIEEAKHSPPTEES